MNLKKGVITFVLICCIDAVFFAQNWKQLGMDINGKGADEKMGFSVSLSSDGQTLAIGSPYNNNFGGTVRIYKLVSGAWVQQGMDINGIPGGSKAGRSVSLSSDGLTVAVGKPAWRDDLLIFGGSAGVRDSINVYKFTGGAWVLQGNAIPGSTSSGEYSFFGVSVSLSSDGLTVATSSPEKGSHEGGVRVYKLISGTWTQQGGDINGQYYDELGASVSLSSDGLTVAVGGRLGASAGGNNGIARMYKLVNGAWVQQGTTLKGKASRSTFGTSVSLSSDGLILAVGGPRYDNWKGYVQVYKLIGSTLVQQGADILGTNTSDYLGGSVALSDDGLSLVVGGEYSNKNGASSSTGHVKFYKFINNSWVQKCSNIDGKVNGELAGTSVSLSSDGQTLAFGAIGRLSAAGSTAKKGTVRVYKVCCTPSPPTTATETACESYTWIDGKTYTSNNTTAIHKLTNKEGCDSVVTLNLTILPSSAPTTAIKTACESYTWIDGKTYTSNNTTATHKLTNKEGCDSVVTLNLTILPSQSTNTTAFVCKESNFTFPSGKVINKVIANTADVENLKGKNGCDSIHTTFLKLFPLTQSNHSFSVKEGENIKILNGKTFNEVKQSFIDTFKTTSSKGCDSLVISIISVIEKEKECHIFIPNTFTPNTDYINAQLVVKAVCAIAFEAEIYDQGGKIIATSTDMNNVWDGKDSSGNNVPINTYAYKMIFINKNNSRVVKFGAINLLR